MWAWGQNAYGGLGLNDVVKRSSPVQVTGTWGGVTKSAQTVVAHQFTA